jgi:hypothetical protein
LFQASSRIRTFEKEGSTRRRKADGSMPVSVANEPRE